MRNFRGEFFSRFPRFPRFPRFLKEQQEISDQGRSKKLFDINLNSFKDHYYKTLI